MHLPHHETSVHIFTAPTGAPFTCVGLRLPAGPEFRLGKVSSSPMLIARIPSCNDTGRPPPAPTGVDGWIGVEKDLPHAILALGIASQARRHIPATGLNRVWWSGHARHRNAAAATRHQWIETAHVELAGLRSSSESCWRGGDGSLFGSLIALFLSPLRKLSLQFIHGRFCLLSTVYRAMNPALHLEETGLVASTRDLRKTELKKTKGGSSWSQSFLICFVQCRATRLLFLKK